MKIQELRDELVTVNADIKQMADGSTDWNIEQFDKLEDSKKKLDKQLGALLRANATEQSAAPIADPVQNVPTPIINEPAQHVYGAEQHGAEPGWAKSPGKGYKGEFMAGQMMSDHIRCVLNGPDAATKAYSQYSAFVTGAEMTAGVTTTLTNGIEIIPELMPSVKEQVGAGVAGLEQMIIETSSKGVIEYYRDENTYQVDGLVAAWTSEGATLTTTRDPINKGLLELDPLYVYAALTQEIMEDAPLLESRYITKAPQVMRVEWWKKILSGNGVGEPLGILNGGSTVSTTRTTANRIKFEDIAIMEARFLGAGTTEGFYVCNQTVIPQLMQLVDGSGAYIWKSNRNEGITSMAGAISGFLLGRPVIVSQDAEALGTVGDFVLINPRGYLAAQMARGVEFATSPHFLFSTRKTALRWDTRVGGMPYFQTANTPRKGGATLSNFVNVAT